MGRDEHLEIVNLSDMAAKRRLIQQITPLQGLYEIWIKPRAKTRTLNANAYYFAAVVTPFRQYLREMWGDELITTEQSHIEIKKAVLGVREKLNERTGEMMELVPATHTMDKVEFASYVDRATELVERVTERPVLGPELFAEERPKKR